MKISQIVAKAANNAIGKDNKLLWHLPKDMVWFKQKTISNPIIMGRNTMGAIKKPLPNRRNIVLSSNPNLVLPGFEWAKTIEQAIEMATRTAKEEIFIIGGGKVYTETLAITDRIYITHINHIFEDADTFYPELNENNWQTSFEEIHEEDDKHKFSFKFEILEKIKNK